LYIYFIFLKTSFLFIFFLGQFIESQLPEQITLQTFMEEFLKMPSQYVEQVMYSVKKQQQRHRSPLVGSKENKRQVSIDHQQQQQQHHHQQQQQGLHSAVTPTTHSTTSASNDS
jgi:amino acid permease